MEEATRNDLKIAGSTTVPGGAFNRVSIAGQAEINGDLDCNDFKISGAADVRGNLAARTARVSGSATVAGDVQSGEMKVSGTFTVRGKVTTGKMNVSGSVDLAGGVAGEEIEVSGYLTTKGDCEAESFTAMGAVTIGGLLNAGNIDIKQYGSSLAREIGGEKISIRVHSFGLHKILKLFHPPGKFTVETIEGDEVHLEHTRAKTVRGNNVTIGPGCDIELVEYAVNASRALFAGSLNNGDVVTGFIIIILLAIATFCWSLRSLGKMVV